VISVKRNFTRSKSNPIQHWTPYSNLQGKVSLMRTVDAL
jgi:hypothetical protein